jgi:hypothetical protein
VDGSAKVRAAKACRRHSSRDFMAPQAVPARAASIRCVQTGRLAGESVSLIKWSRKGEP